MSLEGQRFKMLVAGELVEGTGTLSVINPATGMPVADIALADSVLLEKAVASAVEAGQGWSALGMDARRAYLTQLADAIEARFPELVRLLVLEQGKPQGEAEFEVGGTIGLLRAFQMFDLPMETLREGDGTRIVSQHVPLGVVAVITPWNFPLMLLASKIAPALLTGNTVVAKPAPTTPLTSLLVGEIAANILPPGVLNVIVAGNDVAEALVAHPRVAKVAFTGSTATGRKVMAGAAGTLKRITLELGGNDAALVLDDADVAATAQAVFGAAMLNAGQVCVAPKRVYAPASLYEPLCNALADLARAAVVDDGGRQGTQVGPVQNRQQYYRILDLIEDTKSCGTIVAGGEAVDRDGYFIMPTIVKDVPDSARIVREEQFGPVLPVMAYDSIEDAVARINDSEYGLAATIWTSDPDRAFEIAKRLETGTVWVNKFMDLAVDVPFGGAKQSGLGAEMGLDGLKEYTQLKIINLAVQTA